MDIEAADAAIDINNTSTDPLIHFQVSGTTHFTIGTDVTDSKFKIGTTALETGTAVTVQSNGNVGIGTTTPDYELTISAPATGGGLSGVLRLTGRSDKDNMIRIDYTSNSTNYWLLGPDFNVGEGDAFHLYNSVRAEYDLTVEQSGGDVGIGTVIPDSKVHVVADFAAYSGLKLEHNATGFETEYTVTPGFVAGVETDQCVTMDVTGSGWFIMMDNLRLQGNIYPYADNTYSCGLNGARWTDVFATNGTIQTSDRRLKTNIDTLNYGLAEVMQLTPVSFNWKSDTINEIKRNKIGYIAQEVLKIIPEIVNIGDDENQTLGMNYAEMVVVLTKAIQEQQAIIGSQKQEIETIKAEASSAKIISTETAKKLATLEAKLNALLLLNSKGAVVTAEN